MTNKRKGLIILSFLIGLFLVFRLLVLLTYSNRLYEPEELYRGTIAREIIHGPLISPWEYLDFKVEYFPGGTLVVGILAVPFFLLFGETYFSLKLVGLMFSLGTFALWYLFLDKFFSRRIAVITALIFIFCVPFYTMSSLITWGAHPEASFFTILSIFIFYNIFFGAQEEKKRSFLILGLVNGFGVWFVQTYLITTIFILAGWYIFDKNFFRKRGFLSFMCGSIAGFSPAFYYAFFYDHNIWGINGRPLFLEVFTGNLKGIILKAVNLFWIDLPNSFLFVDSFKVPAQVLAYAYYVIFLSALAFLLWIYRKDVLRLSASLMYPVTLKDVKAGPDIISRESIILAYPLLFFLCYLLSSYSILPQPWEDPRVWPHYIGYRYMIPVMPFMCAVIGIFTGKIRDKKIFGIFVFLALGIGLIGNLNIIYLKNLGRFLNDRGYSYNIIGDKIGLRMKDDLKERIAPFDRLEERPREEFYEGLGSGIAWRLRDKNPDELINIFDTQIKKEYQPSLYRGWGMLFYPDYPQELEDALSVSGRIDGKYRQFFYEGLVKKMYVLYDSRGWAAFLDKVEKEYWPYCYKGLGFSIGFEFRNNVSRQNQLLNEIDKKYRVFVREGIREGTESARRTS